MIESITFIAILMTILIQAPTTEWLGRKLGLLQTRQELRHLAANDLSCAFGEASVMTSRNLRSIKDLLRCSSIACLQRREHLTVFNRNSTDFKAL